MPLFFLIAGWALSESLARRGLVRVLRERSRKLLLPLGFGMVAFGPFLRWIELQHGLLKSASGQLLPRQVLPFWEIAGRYFTQPGLLTWAHLWFLAYLWTFTMLYLPLWCVLIKVARSMSGSKTVLSRISSSLALVLPLAAIASLETLLRDTWPGYQNLFDDWANFATFSVFFLFGMVLGHAPAPCQALNRFSGALLVTGVVASLCQTSLRMQVWASYLLTCYALDTSACC